MLMPTTTEASDSAGLSSRAHAAVIAKNPTAAGSIGRAR